MLAVTLSDETERRLAARTGRTMTFHAHEAIEAHLDDLDDLHIADERLRDFRAGNAVPLVDVLGSMSTDDKARTDLLDALRALWVRLPACDYRVAE